MKNLAETFKRWGIAFICGGIIGMMLQQNIFFYEIETDCKYMKSFRHKQFVYDCVERKAL